MICTETNLIVLDVKSAKKFYKETFNINIIEETNFELGFNEICFEMYDSRFRMLDENHEHNIYAPKDPSIPKSIWTNIILEDIESVYKNVKKNEKTTIIQELTHMEDYGVISFMFLDPFGYTWLIQEITKTLDFETRAKIMHEEFIK